MITSTTTAATIFTSRLSPSPVAPLGLEHEALPRATPGQTLNAIECVAWLARMLRLVGVSASTLFIPRRWAATKPEE